MAAKGRPRRLYWVVSYRGRDVEATEDFELAKTVYAALRQGDKTAATLRRKYMTDRAAGHVEMDF